MGDIGGGPVKAVTSKEHAPRATPSPSLSTDVGALHEALSAAPNDKDMP